MMLIVKWIVKSVVSAFVMFGISGYLLFLSTGKTPWSLLGHSSPGAFFASLLPQVNVPDSARSAQVSLQAIANKTDALVTQYVPSASWLADDEATAAGKEGGSVIYKWVDAKGVTHFSESPPAQGESETVVLESAVNILPSQVGSAVPSDNPNENLLKQLQADLEQQQEQKQEMLESL